MHAEYQTADAGEFLKKYQFLGNLQCNNYFPYITNLYWPPDSFGCWNLSLTARKFCTGKETSQFCLEPFLAFKTSSSDSKMAFKRI